MFIVFYPCADEFNGATFNHLDWNKKEEAKVVFKQLYKEFHKDYMFKFYDISTISRSSKFPCLDDMVEDFNNEEISVESCFSVYLNLTEKDIEDCIEEVCAKIEEEEKAKGIVDEGIFFFIIGSNFNVEKYSDGDDYLMYQDQAECSESLCYRDNGYIQVECKKRFPFCGEMSAEVYGFKEGEKAAFLGSFEYDNTEENNFYKKLVEFVEQKEKFWYFIG